MQIFEATKPFEIVHLDIIGPLPLTKSGNRYILTIMDRFSRMVKLIPIPIMTASCICIEFRNHWLLQYGVSMQTLTDRGSNFAGLLFKLLSKLYGFTNLFTTSYHPRTNGRLERFHRYLKERLRILSAELNLDYFNTDDWDIFLPNISFSYNITPNRMTKYSPYQIIFGDTIKLPIDRVLNVNVNDVVDDVSTNFKSPTDWRVREITLNAEHRGYIDALTKQQKQLRKEIRDNMKTYNLASKAAYDKKRVPPLYYGPNQPVFIDDTVGKVGNKKKMAINQRRARIIDKIAANAYVVAYDDGRIEPVNIERIFTTSRSRKSKKSQNNKRNQRRMMFKRRKRDNTNLQNDDFSDSEPPSKRQRIQQQER